MTILKYELKSYIKSFLIWSVSIVSLLFMFMSIYPTFGSDQEMVEKLMANYPEEMLKAFGMSTGLPLSSVLGYCVFIFAFVQLLIAIQASNYGFSILSVEERELTADFLMSKPVSRRNILISKVLAAVITLLLTNIVCWITTISSIEIFKGDKEYELGNLALFLATIALFQLFFLVVGMLVSVCVSKIRSVLSYSMGLAFGMYILNAIRSIIDGELLGYFTPFYHFEPSYIMEHGKLDSGMALISISIIVVGAITTYILYQKRDIHSL